MHLKKTYWQPLLTYDNGYLLKIIVLITLKSCVLTMNNGMIVANALLSNILIRKLRKYYAAQILRCN